MSKIKSIDHAIHNEKVCNYLSKKSDYGDWIITTAFYSALHFLRHKIFPFYMNTEDGKKIKVSEFEVYCLFCNLHKSKHAIFSELVEKKAKPIAPEYNNLKDISFTARYVNYNYDRDISSLAKKQLLKIKEYCLK